MREDELNVKQVDRRIKKRRDERIRSLQSNHSPWPAVPRSLSSAKLAVRRPFDRCLRENAGVKSAASWAYKY